MHLQSIIPDDSYVKSIASVYLEKEAASVAAIHDAVGILQVNSMLDILLENPGDAGSVRCCRTLLFQMKELFNKYLVKNVDKSSMKAYHTVSDITQEIESSLEEVSKQGLEGKMILTDKEIEVLNDDRFVGRVHPYSPEIYKDFLVEFPEIEANYKKQSSDYAAFLGKKVEQIVETELRDILGASKQLKELEKHEAILAWYSGLAKVAQAVQYFIEKRKFEFELESDKKPNCHALSFNASLQLEWQVIKKVLNGNNQGDLDAVNPTSQRQEQIMKVIAERVQWFYRLRGRSFIATLAESILNESFSEELRDKFKGYLRKVIQKYPLLIDQDLLNYQHKV